MKKRVLSMALAVVMMFAMAGCGKYENKVNDEYEDGKLVIDFFGHGLDSMQGLTPDSKKILDYVEDKFQIKFKTTTATVSSAPTLLNQLISGGDVPDMFIHFLDEPSYSKWLKEDYLFNYSDYIDDYPHLKANFTALGTENVVKNFLGGDYYSFPIVLHSNKEPGYLSVEMAMYYRRDWYQALKNKNFTPSSGRPLVDPEDPSFNYLNFYDLLEGYTYGDPDGNNKDDTYGYALNKDSGIYWWYPILNMFNVEADGWEYNEERQMWVPEILTERGKEAVMFMADMYDHGFINSNYNTTTTFEMAKSNFCSGKAGVVTYNSIPGIPEGTLDMMTQFVGKVAGSTKMGDVVRGMPVVTGKDGVKRIKGAVNNYAYLAINNDISETKKRKILEIMDWIFTEDGDTTLTWGIEGEHWEYDSKHNKKSLLPLDNAGNQHLLQNDPVAPAAYRIKGIASWEKYYTNFPRPYVKESEQIRTAWKEEYLYIDELTFVRVDTDYITIETELEDKVAMVCKNIVATIKNKPEETRENLWNSLISYWNERGGDYIKAKNQAAKAIINK